MLTEYSLASNVPYRQHKSRQRQVWAYRQDGLRAGPPGWARCTRHAKYATRPHACSVNRNRTNRFVRPPTDARSDGSISIFNSNDIKEIPRYQWTSDSPCGERRVIEYRNASIAQLFCMI